VCVFLPLQIEPFGFASGSMSVSLPLQIEPFDFAAATIVSLILQIEPFGLLQQEICMETKEVIIEQCPTLSQLTKSHK
jgi:hypothetical protein